MGGGIGAMAGGGGQPGQPNPLLGMLGQGGGGAAASPIMAMIKAMSGGMPQGGGGPAMPGMPGGPQVPGAAAAPLVPDYLKYKPPYTGAPQRPNITPPTPPAAAPAASSDIAISPEEQYRRAQMDDLQRGRGGQPIDWAGIGGQS